jgi:RNA polymerase sigma-54 factor
MNSLSPRLQLRVAQKQILTPGLVQMVTVLQLNRLELKDMILSEIAQNPVLEEGADGIEEMTPEEVQQVLERERVLEPSDQSIREVMDNPNEPVVAETEVDLAEFARVDGNHMEVAPELPGTAEPEAAEAPKTESDPFDEIDFGTYFDEYLDPGYKSPASENVEKPSFETFLSSPVTLADHLHQQLAVLVMPEDVRDAAMTIIGNLDENGYLTTTLEEIAAGSEHTVADVEEALKVVQTLDPAGVGARTLQECLLIQLESRNAKGGVAWQIIQNHLNLLEKRQHREMAKALGRPLEHIQIALSVIITLDPRPGLRYSGPGARAVEPDV